jgi:ABC-2 type transport system ATP-binding protein
MTTAAIEATGLRKSYGEVHALDGVDLHVQQGTVLGLLGPNGAGKTTAVRILTTLLHPDAGHATVAGFDVARQQSELRSVIGLAGQFAAVDQNLTGRENLEMVGRLYHLGGPMAKARATELLTQFDLVDAADRPSKTYSGGMRRRLDLAASLVKRPRVLFLDEPTTGLDPRSRMGMWDVIAGLVSDGTTLLLTTQYLEEADRLADRISVIDGGKVIAEGTSDELKTRLGGDVIDVRLGHGVDTSAAVTSLQPLAAGPIVHQESGAITIPVNGGSAVLPEVVRTLDGLGLHITELSLHRPSLDDVFLSLTGHGAEERGNPAAAGRRRGRRSASADTNEEATA